jgi:dUTP pyrophosphatase
MNKINIKIKKVHPDAVTPKQGFETDSGYDLVAIDDGVATTSSTTSDIVFVEYDTGVQIELPEGYHTEIYPRSSISKTHLLLANSIGLIDNSYRGNLKLRFRLLKIDSNEKWWKEKQLKGEVYKKGDKIGQLVIKKTIYADFEEVTELNTSDRSESGFGSTGN